MRRINDNFFYDLAKNLRPVSAFKTDQKLNDVIFMAYDAERWLEFLLLDNIVPLSVCKNSGHKLLAALKGLTEHLGSEPAELARNLEFHEVYAITNGIKEFETVLAAELQTLDTYFISQTGIYSTPDLIERAERMFPEAIRKHIPDHATKDIRQAGKCLAFELPTAAAFHMLRAAESLIREYYKVIFGHYPKMKSRNWSRYIHQLRSKKADAKILAALDQVKEMHRNPLMHPEEFLSNEEAQTLFSVAQGIIVSIAVDIENRKKPPESTGILPGLGLVAGALGGTS